MIICNRSPGMGMCFPCPLGTYSGASGSSDAGHAAPTQELFSDSEEFTGLCSGVQTLRLS